MKLAKGVTVVVGKEKFTDYIPDEKAKQAGILKEKKAEAKEDK